MTTAPNDSTPQVYSHGSPAIGRIRTRCRELREQRPSLSVDTLGVTCACAATRRGRRAIVVAVDWTKKDATAPDSISSGLEPVHSGHRLLYAPSAERN